jgi:hypothetical protein
MGNFISEEKSIEEYYTCQDIYAYLKTILNIEELDEKYIVCQHIFNYLGSIFESLKNVLDNRKIHYNKNTVYEDILIMEHIDSSDETYKSLNIIYSVHYKTFQKLKFERCNIAKQYIDNLETLIRLTLNFSGHVNKYGVM